MTDLLLHECLQQKDGQINIGIELDGRRVKDAIIFCGLNKKEIETHVQGKHFLDVSQVLLDFDWYCGSPYNMTYAFILAYEGSLGESAPQNAQAMRMVFAELSRIYTHILALNKILKALQWGPMVGFMSKILLPLKKVIDALHKNYPLRPLGFSSVFAPSVIQDIENCLAFLEVRITKAKDKVLKNTLFKIRTVGVGTISRPDCLSYGVSGLVLRSAGVLYDHRQAHPYDLYAHTDFSIPVGSVGDTYERVVLRFAECIQSIEIIKQALSFISPDSPSFSEQGQYFLNPKPSVTSSLFQMKAHYVRQNGLPMKHAYVEGITEGSRGLAQFFAYSDNQATLKDVSFKYGSFFNAQLIPFLVRNCSPEDVDVIVASLDISPKELDH